ncbi:MAG: hypothetical protein ACOY2B_05245 [Pseudomonadota bacterium]
MNNRKPIFAPRAEPGKLALVTTKGGDVMALVSQARHAGGFLAGWRIGRVVNGESIELVAEAVRAHFAAKREELIFRTDLALDEVKKRAMAENLADTAIIEREIARMTADIIRELIDVRLDAAREAAFAEVRRIRELEAARAKGEVTERRFEAVLRQIEQCTDDICDKAEAVVARVIENIGQRLDAALRGANCDRPG